MPKLVLALALMAAAAPVAAHQRPCVDSEARCCVEGQLWVADLGRCVVPTS